ncbi:MAG: hypothetical protein A1D16_11435 [Flavihumibacter sp. CACIAM 22H1]|nr:hypothetical protein [Flavihumibacter sp. CACIAM 22H1]KYP13821.1 MAG: hypothetical protein A1D16_11435 [Flavihumibacter sp. CACIAM 22H1]
MKNIDDLADLKRVGSGVYNGVERTINKVELHIATPVGYNREVLRNVIERAGQMKVDVRFIDIE